MTQEELNFLQFVERFIYSNPHMLAGTINSIQLGISNKLAAVKESAIDFETVSYIALTPRALKSSKAHVASLIRKHSTINAFDWSANLERLEKGSTKITPA